MLSSLSGEIGLPYRTAYCSSKFAVTGFFEALRIELENKDIAITIVCPPSVRISLFIMRIGLRSILFIKIGENKYERS